MPKKPRLAVLEFKYRGDLQWWWHAGAGVAQDEFINELVKSGKFQVISREELFAMLSEKGLDLSGDVDPSKAVKAGKLLGVNYLVTGTVTEFGDRNAGGTRLGKRDVVVAMNARLIDTHTGETNWSDERTVSENSAKIAGSDDRLFHHLLKTCVQQLTQSLKSAD